MLAVLEMEGGRNPEASEAVRDEVIRVRRWGRWRHSEAQDDVRNPLLASDDMFSNSSLLLFVSSSNPASGEAWGCL